MVHMILFNFCLKMLFSDAICCQYFKEFLFNPRMPEGYDRECDIIQASMGCDG